MGYYSFPHTRTYDSDLGWLICQTKKLLEMYDKWDQLPDMIKEILQEYIETGEINDIIEDIIGDFVLNPKYPPSPDIPKASGDGSTDDTESIQGCINYAAEHGKLGVYFPTGAYLTGSLTLKDGVSLFGSDRYTTRIVLKAGATSPLLSGNVTNMGIHRLTLDSNAGNQVNNITTVSITAGTDIEFNDLIFASGYVNLSYLGTSGHLQLSNIIFANAVLKHLLIAGTADVQAENLMFENLSAVSGNCCMDISTDRGSYRFTSEASTPACIRCSGSGNRFEGFIHNAVENVVNTGTGNDYIIYGQSQTETLSGDKKLTAANIIEQISGDKTVNAGDYNITAENINEVATKKEVTGNTTFYNNVAVEGTTYTKNTVMNGALNVTGATTMSDATVQNASVNGTLNVTGNTTMADATVQNISVNGTLNVTGNTTMADMAAQNTSVNGTLNVTGKTTMADTAVSGGLTVAGMFDTPSTIKYLNPVGVNDFYSNVPVIDREGNTYNLMVATNQTEKISNNIGSQYPGVIAIGDSYGRGEGGGSVGKYTPWTTYLKDYLGLVNGTTFWTASMGGAGFKGNSQGKNFNDLLNDVSGTMNEDQRKSVGKIVVGGGYNDSTDFGPTYMESFFNTAKSVFPNAKVYIACIGWTTNRGFATNIFNNAATSYSQGAGMYGGIYIVNSEYSLHNYTWFDSDGIHPNNTGQQHIAQMLAQGIYTGVCNNLYNLVGFTVTPNTAVCETTQMTGFCCVNNGITSMFFDFGSNLVFNHSVSTDSQILIGTINCDLINAIENANFCSLPVVAYTAYDSGKYFNPYMNVWISGKNVYMNIININPEETSFKTIGTLGTMSARFLNTTFMTGYC